ncbi:uncharacterized protein [Nicotiana tomentosiformis]|uniref:uncharacterized protein n=1 Tax=Nicotiana tomentosiformis TaxID=4098 RepID=UPI00388CB376
MEQDAKVFVQTRDKCQRYAHLVHQPEELLHSVVLPWPFMKCGMDIVGPLPQVPGHVKFHLILIDYFTKCVEPGAFKKNGEREVTDFIWDHIICRFGISKETAFDNESQFIGFKITKFLERLKIKRITSFLYHPSANGQAESTYQMIIQKFKSKLEDDKGKWPEELPEYCGHIERRKNRAHEKYLFPLYTVSKL